jgi:hypothetical protein
VTILANRFDEPGAFSIPNKPEIKMAGISARKGAQRFAHSRERSFPESARI